MQKDHWTKVRKHPSVSYLYYLSFVTWGTLYNLSERNNVSSLKNEIIKRITQVFDEYKTDNLNESTL